MSKARSSSLVGRRHGGMVLLLGCLFVLGGSLAAVGQDTADLDKSGFVDAEDLLLFHEQWHTEGAFAPSTDPVNQVSSEIQGVTIAADLRPEIKFSLIDGNGDPVNTTGATLRFILARIIVDDAANDLTHYESYTTRAVSNQVGDATPGTVNATQANFATGVVTPLGGGMFSFKFTDPIANFDPTLTHTVGAQLQRSGQWFVNPLFTFRPDGGNIVETRMLSSTETCNNCHTRLAIHGGGRREFGLCILCHNPAPGNIDPDSGNTIDMATLIHKLHNGEDGYMIYGNQNSLHDYTHVEYPQDIRNCDSCHTGPQADFHAENPSRRACGSCHSDVNFDTGVGHGPGIPQLNDMLCSGCHPADLPGNGMAVVQAHTLPRNEADFPQIVLELLDVANVAAGVTPTITFRVNQIISGVTTTLAPGDLNRLAVTVAGFDGPDYASDRTDTISNANSTNNGDGTFSFNLLQPLPADAVGTFAFGLEARDDAIDGTRPAGNNPVVFKAITGDPVPRRHIIDGNKCNLCHDQLRIHGDLRTDFEYCVLCHRPERTDEARIPAGATDAVATTIDFKVMIHKIHTGEDLEKGYAVYGFGSNHIDFSEVLFPGRREKCEICHLPGTYSPPAPEGALDTVVTQMGNEISRIPSTSASCTGCHDGDAAVAHAESFVAINGGTENCASCHGDAHEFAVNFVHDIGP